MTERLQRDYQYLSVEANDSTISQEGHFGDLPKTRARFKSRLYPCLLCSVTMLLLTLILISFLLFRSCDTLDFISWMVSLFNRAAANLNSTIHHPLESTYYTNNSNPYSVILFGDSMINMPYTEHDLSGKIQSNLPGLNLVLTNAGINGQTISEIRTRLDSDVITLKPDAVILFWNSDCTKRSEDGKTSEEVQLMRDTYAADLSYVIDQITDTGSHLAVAGPAILGESYGLFMPVSNQYYHKKWPMAETYRSINRQITTEKNVTYIDVRQAFLDRIPFFELSFSQCVTEDGVHENERGTAIVANLFADVIYTWLQSATSRPPQSEELG